MKRRQQGEKGSVVKVSQKTVGIHSWINFVGYKIALSGTIHLGRLIKCPPFQSRMRMFSSFKLMVIGLSVPGQIFGKCNLVPPSYRIRLLAPWGSSWLCCIYFWKWSGYFRNEFCLTVKLHSWRILEKRMDVHVYVHVFPKIICSFWIV